MKITFFIYFLFLLLVTSAYAFDCSLVSDVDTCNNIVNSELSDTEKEELYQALLFVEFPDYDYVYDYNTAVEWTSTPENVTEFDSRYIKNAWIMLASVMPSVSINDTLYYSGDASVLTGYDYDIEIPSETISGDCRTIYDVNSVSRSHRVYVNGNIVGYSELTSFTSEEDVDIIYGSNMKASVKEFPNVEYSNKDEVVNLLKKKGLYEKYSMLCTIRLNSSVFKKEIDSEILALAKLVKGYRISLSKRSR